MFTKMCAKVESWRASEEGATAVEYGIMVALIAAAIILTVTDVGTALDGLFKTIEAAL